MTSCEDRLNGNYDGCSSRTMHWQLMTIFLLLQTTNLQSSVCSFLRVVPTPPPPPPPPPPQCMVAIGSHISAAVCSRNMQQVLKIEHHDSIVYSKHNLILTFLAGAFLLAIQLKNCQPDFYSRCFFFHTLPCNIEFLQQPSGSTNIHFRKKQNSMEKEVCC